MTRAAAEAAREAAAQGTEASAVQESAEMPEEALQEELCSSEETPEAKH